MDSIEQAGKLPERLGELATEARNPRSERLDQLPTLEMLGILNEEDAVVAGAVKAVLPEIARAVDEISERFARSGRLFYVGAGTSGRLGVLDASECPPTFGVSPELFVGIIAGGDGALRRSSEGSEDDALQGAADLVPYSLNADGSLVGIAASGRTPYVLGAMSAAKQAGALTIALTCAPGSRMGALAEIAIELATGAEALTGSTRMKAGTATKMVLNMISTGVMVRRGAVFGNLMVNVQTTNAKLLNRAERIVAAASGCDGETASRLLKEGGGVKMAIVMARLEIGREAAKARLARHDGLLRAAISDRG